MSSTKAPIFKIIPTTQKYDWGKIGSSSKVAQFASKSKVPEFALDEGTPYAELWMGTHSSSPARLLSGTTLASHLASHKQLIGTRVLERFADAGAGEGNLPFLLKVLAIAKALSIQTHPDKKMAERLHKERPDIYKDANHKPEMAIAITDFEALCGFRPLSQISTFLESTPEFAALIPTAIAGEFKALSGSNSPDGPQERAALKNLFAAVMTAEKEAFVVQLDKLIRRYEVGGTSSAEDEIKELVLRINGQFPADIGTFCAFILNYVRMVPGEAIFLAAGEPHAYISGDIIECMATSDNVIRAGLTPKLRDVPNLVAGLTYLASDHRKHLVQPTTFSASSRVSPHTTLYDPPIPEFAVLRTVLSAGETEEHGQIDGPSIVIVTEGSGDVSWDSDSLEVSEGDVFFIGANTPAKFRANKGQGFTIFRAFVEVE
ncbi:mannos-6-phosphate isomerase [Irpex rosettiformis]|uniref:Mannos-6-phosphate isomerase n=1 Tax=Irpex rosettiformis TaxID=378272 RepID=A0ACB8TYY4_9APHY|nr:mannos-6-phosphate isomerase [Irpex rosettiformis]